MILKTLSIINYKNIEQANIELSPKLNCLIGANGVGKTNLLDTIYYLSFCRSAFSQTNQHVIRHKQEAMMIQGVYNTPDGNELNIYCGLKTGRKKSFKKNGKEYLKISEHIGLIPLIMVSPGDTELIMGTGEPRRKFIDSAISQYSHTYLQQLIRYNQVLQQRNSLLKSDTEPNETLLTAYDEMLAQSGAVIFKHRKEFIDRYIPLFNKVYNQIGNSDEQVALVYHSHLNEGDFFNMLQASHQRDCIVGYTLKGIHRDDLEMMLGNYPIRYEGSQGQTKSYLTALRLAQYLYLKQVVSDRKALLLLDDIFDKLDAKRVERIIRIVSSEDYGQIFITSTSNEPLRQLIARSAQDYKFFVVNNGTYEAH